LRNLRVLRLNLLGRLTDKAVPVLQNFGKLEELDLACAGITDAAVKDLKELKSLKKLDVGCTRITEVGFKELAQALPDTRVHR